MSYEDLQARCQELERKLASFTSSNIARDLRVFIGSWNLANSAPPEDLSPWLDRHAARADIVAIGLQEGYYSSGDKITSTKHFKRLVMNALGRRFVHLRRVGITDRRKDKKSLIKEMEDYANIQLHVFVAVEHRFHTHDITTSLVKTGILDSMGLGYNKGGVALSFSLYGRRYCFINSHLAAHQQKLDERNLDFKRISAKLDLRGVRDVEVTTSCHYVFWFGDLNYRIDMPRDEAVALIEECKSGTKPWAELIRLDQLTRQRAEQRAFALFDEPDITFPPTFKYIKGTSEYDAASGRVPSWTDRILYRCRPGNALAVERYTACDKLVTSDHRPISATFTVHRPSIMPRKTGPFPFRMLVSDINFDSLEADYSVADYSDDNLDDFVQVDVVEKQLRPPDAEIVEFFYADEEEMYNDTLVFALRCGVRPDKAFRLMEKRMKGDKKFGEATVLIRDLLTGQPVSIRMYQRGVPVASVRARFSLIPVFADVLHDPSVSRDDLAMTSQDKRLRKGHNRHASMSGPSRDLMKDPFAGDSCSGAQKQVGSAGRSRGFTLADMDDASPRLPRREPLPTSSVPVANRQARRMPSMPLSNDATDTNRVPLSMREAPPSIWSSGPSSPVIGRRGSAMSPILPGRQSELEHKHTAPLAHSISPVVRRSSLSKTPQSPLQSAAVGFTFSSSLEDPSPLPQRRPLRVGAQRHTVSGPRRGRTASLSSTSGGWFTPTQSLSMPGSPRASYVEQEMFASHVDTDSDGGEQYYEPEMDDPSSDSGGESPDTDTAIGRSSSSRGLKAAFKGLGKTIQRLSISPRANRKRDDVDGDTPPGESYKTSQWES